MGDLEYQKLSNPGTQIVQHLRDPLCVLVLYHPPEDRDLMRPELESGLLIEALQRHIACSEAGIFLQIVLRKSRAARGQLVQIGGRIRPVRQSQIRRDIGKTRSKCIFMHIEDHHLRPVAAPPQIIRQKVLMHQSCRQSGDTLKEPLRGQNQTGKFGFRDSADAQVGLNVLKGWWKRVEPGNPPAVDPATLLIGMQMRQIIQSYITGIEPGKQSEQLPPL